MKATQEGKCSLCTGEYTRWGNNPQPLKAYDERCCDECNWKKVIPARCARVLGVPIDGETGGDNGNGRIR